MNYTRTLISAILAGLALAWGLAALLVRDPSRRNLEVFTEMQYSVAAESQQLHPSLPGGLVEQPPPEGTYYRGQGLWRHPAMKLDALSNEERATLTAERNPWLNGKQAELEFHTRQGKALFEKACQGCHGANGAGGMPVGAFYPGIANLMGGNAKAYSDGELFQIISYGVRSMPGHEALLSTHERWKVILHLRQLQRGKP